MVTVTVHRGGVGSSLGCFPSTRRTQLTQCHRSHTIFEGSVLLQGQWHQAIKALLEFFFSLACFSFLLSVVVCGVQSSSSSSSSRRTAIEKAVFPPRINVCGWRRRAAAPRSSSSSIDSHASRMHANKAAGHTYSITHVNSSCWGAPFTFRGPQVRRSRVAAALLLLLDGKV